MPGGLQGLWAPLQDARPSDRYRCFPHFSNRRRIPQPEETGPSDSQGPSRTRHPSTKDSTVTQSLEGRTGIILGVANKRSIAWACASSLAREGMRLCFTYMGERMEEKVRELAEECPGSIVLECDVTQPEQIDRVFESIKEEFGFLDTVVHAVAFAKREELKGDFYETSKDGYMIAHEVSAYSLTAVARRALPLMEGRDGSLVTLTYLGSERVIQNYNVMGLAKASLEANVRYMAGSLGRDGIRVNAISAGPIKTLAASGIKSFRRMLAENARRAPLRRNVTTDEVGNAAAFMCSDMASGITGEIMYVDAGFNITGMGELED